MAQPVLTVGTLSFEDNGGRPRWIIDAQPHVRIRLKNLFGGIIKSRTREMQLSHNDDNCRDLLWFLGRYPMAMSDADRKILKSGATRHRKRGERIVQILKGDFQLPTATMALPARRYQEQAATLVLENRHLLLVDDLGIGKTVSAIQVMTEAKALPALCVVLAPLIYQWRDEIRKFMPSLRTHIIEGTKPYDLRDENGQEPHVIIMAYTRLHGWVEELVGKIRYVVFDEVQELRTGHTEESGGYKISKKNVAAAEIARSADYRLGLSGTPIYNYGGELWNLLDILAPGAMGERYEFLREWCAGTDRKAEVVDPQALGTYLRSNGLVLRRTRDDVGRYLPPVSTVLHEIHCDYGENVMNAPGAAAELARIVLDASAKTLDRGQASRQLDIMLRQATGVEKAPHVAAFVRILLEQQPNEKVVLFGWHRETYGIWAELLADKGIAWYTGTESPAKKVTETARFLEGDARVLLMSLRAGLGLNGLQDVCATAVFGELDWTPGIHEQCIGRLQRDGQKRPIFAYYVLSDSGSDPIICDVLGLKTAQLHGIRDPGGAPLTTRKADESHIKKLAEAYLKSVGYIV